MDFKIILQINDESKNYIRKTTKEDIINKQYFPECIDAKIEMMLDGLHLYSLVSPEVKKELKSWDQNLEKIPAFDFLDRLLRNVYEFIEKNRNELEFTITGTIFGIRLRQDEGEVKMDFIMRRWGTRSKDMYYPMGTITKNELIRSVIACGNTFLNTYLRLNSLLEEDESTRLLRKYIALLSSKIT